MLSSSVFIHHNIRMIPAVCTVYTSIIGKYAMWRGLCKITWFVIHIASAGRSSVHFWNEIRPNGRILRIVSRPYNVLSKLKTTAVKRLKILRKILVHTTCQRIYIGSWVNLKCLQIITCSWWEIKSQKRCADVCNEYIRII